MNITQINNLPNDEYHNGDKYKEYWSSSDLKEYINTPREAYYQKFLSEKKESDAMTFGSQFHDFFESKHITGKPFNWNIFEPPVNKTTGKPYGKGTNAYLLSLSQVESPISADDLEIIEDIYQMAINSHYRWFFEKEIFTKGIAEPSFFVESGIHRYKYRADVLTDKFIFDYKTVTKNNWSIEKLLWVIKDRGYDVSAAFYQFFEYQRTGIWKPFYVIWLMKEPPYDILIQDISYYCYEVFSSGELSVNSGAMTFLKLKSQHELCEVSGQWPGMANQFKKFKGIRIAEIAPRFERGFDEFEID